MSQPEPTGRREHRDGNDFLVIERRFTAPIEAVWSAVTEPERLARWIGTWTGDPASGAVEFRMLYEGEGPASEVFTILECEEPRRLSVTSTVPFDEGRLVEWHLTLDLTEAAGVTTLAFGQSVPEPAMAESVGPGWEYYLDRLVAAESGGDPASLDFDDYFPSQSGHYLSAFA